ncbi:MAG TPA: hypothetical protein VEW48_06980 [Thermoanaerobaculia bacterium]|nr:hypothetical protein [Thermoanaerobaculia bacterium]
MSHRNYDHAYFENEQGTKVPGENLYFNKFRELGKPWNQNVDLTNYLDPSLRTQLQPQVIPRQSQGMASRYDFYIGQKTWNALARSPPPVLKVTLLFGVERDLDNLGLRYYFEQVEDRVLINIPGREGARWNIGISGLVDSSLGIVTNQVQDFFNLIGFTSPYTITTLAAYSTGYGGLNQTVNEGLIPLKDVETVVYYDCVYRADKPALPSGEAPVALSAAETNNGADEIDASHNGSAFNTQRARKKLLDATSNNVKIVAYMATTGGSPLYKNPTISGPQYTVDIPTKIDLRAATPGSPVTLVECLFALTITRCLAYAEIEGQVNAREVPASFKDLRAGFPQRGQVASSTATLAAKPGFSPTTTLLDWGRANAAKVKTAQKDIDAAIKLISDRELMYVGGYPGPTNVAGALHAALLPEFGWEFLL